jgi:hypothetical protein
MSPSRSCRWTNHYADHQYSLTTLCGREWEMGLKVYAPDGDRRNDEKLTCPICKEVLGDRAAKQVEQALDNIPDEDE